jgi:5-(carboxyamino)imidazole ribonucleotide synthase
MFSTTTRIGILGGGQLGKMLCLAAANLDLKTYVLETSDDYPAAPYAYGFEKGDFRNYEDVLRFGKDKDILTIEIEHVNTDALRALERLGKKVFPSPDALDIIKDKGLQKQFYAERGIPTAPFELFDDEEALRRAVQEGRWKFPFVQKTRTAGYDGRGVALLRSAADLDSKLLPGPCLAEQMADLDKEIAVIAARSPSGEVCVFPPVEMDFHPEANLVEFLICPARISPLDAARAEALAEHVVESFGTCGLLAVEMFLNKDGELWVNEVAPRPHNSGHHTIETALTSQYQQHLRAICDLPLGATDQTTPAVMLNLLGAEGHTGPVRYEGMEVCLALPGVFVHLYGKARTSPFRKMGHVTVGGTDTEDALRKARFVKDNLRVVTHDSQP